jgi:hypothetical protein
LPGLARPFFPPLQLSRRVPSALLLGFLKLAWRVLVLLLVAFLVPLLALLCLLLAVALLEHLRYSPR